MHILLYVQMTLQLHINIHMNYILHCIHTLRYIYPTDFVNWLWDSLSPMEKAERQNVLQEFINIALQQPGAKKEILSNLL